MLRAPHFFLLMLIAAQASADAPAQLQEEAWVGAAVCGSCHSAELEAWSGSHHDLAMQAATEATVLGDFDNSSFDHYGVVSRFFRRGDEFWVATDGPDGKPEEFRVEYVFGVSPLQQYLLALPGGRLQALTVAWDSRPASEGGARWFHLYPDEPVPAGDPLHWTGPYQNWNVRCAECHSTNLQKNLDPRTGEYATTWSEVDVACEACHGPGKLHVELVKAGKPGTAVNAGFPVALAESGRWRTEPGQDIASRTEPLAHSSQVENCGRCHARRGTLGEYEYGQDLMDTHRVSLLEEPLYHVDGQIRDEVYVYGSFRQSAMYQAGVVCSNCHEPHSLELRAPDNAVCSQCHKPERYDSVSHHRHPASSDGALCANCHMPATTYMVVDPRRDHSMRVPRPDLSAVIGTPNACNQCHQDKTPDWAVSSLRKWGVDMADTGTHPARLLSLARSGDARTVPALKAMAEDGGRPAIWRATAMVQLGGFGNQDAVDAAIELLQAEDPLLRAAAVSSLEFLPPQQRYSVLSRHLDDPVTAVRMEVARLLADIPLQQLEPRQAEQLRRLFEEYLHTLGRHTDMPSVQLQMGVFFTARGFQEPAERAYRNAIALNGQLIPAYLNLADLYRALQREDEARQLLLKATEIAPDQASAWHSLGLLEFRTGNQAAAMKALGRAAELEQQGMRNRYVYAIALHDSGRADEAVRLLRSLLRENPENPDVLLALITYNSELGRSDEARRYAEKLRGIMPDDPSVQRLYDSL